MGSSSVMIIGDDWRDQFDRYQSLEYASSDNRYIVQTDRLAEAREKYPNATVGMMRLEDGREVASFDEIDDAEMRAGIRYRSFRKPLNGAEPFATWARKHFGGPIVEPGQEPDLVQKHRFGWMRTNEAGEVTELVGRDIPGSFYFWFKGTCSDFLLKPGATGRDIDESGVVTEVTEGYAGSARLCDIDLVAMRQKKLDAMPQARAGYVAQRTSHRGALSYYDVIRHGEHLEKPAEAELLAGLAPDVLLTSILVKC